MRRRPAPRSAPGVADSEQGERPDEPVPAVEVRSPPCAQFLASTDGYRRRDSEMFKNKLIQTLSNPKTKVNDKPVPALCPLLLESPTSHLSTSTRLRYPLKNGRN